MKQDIIYPGQVTEETLGAAVAEFLLRIRPQRERLLDNYRGEQPIPKGEAVRGRPNNLLRVPFPRYITESTPGTFWTCPPTLAFPAQEDAKAFSQLETNLRQNILQLSMAPDLSDESFAGATSGIALQYKLWGIEQVRSAKERSFSAALTALLQVLAAGMTVLGSPVTLEGGISQAALLFSQIVFQEALSAGTAACSSASAGSPVSSPSRTDTARFRNI